MDEWIDDELNLPSNATVKPETGLPDVNTVNLFSIPAMPLIRPPPCAEILILDFYYCLQLINWRLNAFNVYRWMNESKRMNECLWWSSTENQVGQRTIVDKTTRIIHSHSYTYTYTYTHMHIINEWFSSQAITVHSIVGNVACNSDRIYSSREQSTSKYQQYSTYQQALLQIGAKTAAFNITTTFTTTILNEYR